MAVALEGIANEQQLEVGVNGPGGADRLIVIDGRAAFNLTPGAGNDRASDTLRFPIGPTLAPGDLVVADATDTSSGSASRSTSWRRCRRRRSDGHEQGDIPYTKQWAAQPKSELSV